MSGGLSEGLPQCRSPPDRPGRTGRSLCRSRFPAWPHVPGSHGRGLWTHPHPWPDPAVTGHIAAKGRNCRYIAGSCILCSAWPPGGLPPWYIPRPAPEPPHRYPAGMCWPEGRMVLPFSGFRSANTTKWLDRLSVPLPGPLPRPGSPRRKKDCRLPPKSRFRGPDKRHRTAVPVLPEP